MSDIKKDHSVGAGTGAVGGAIAGGVVGSTVGPIGTVVGAIAGGVLGAKAGDSIAEAVNPTAYVSSFENRYRDTPYCAEGREWNDYKPAYKYSYDTYGEYRGQKFDDVERARAQVGGHPCRVPPGVAGSQGRSQGWLALH
jgi:uncharacterized protein YcfJ